MVGDRGMITRPGSRQSATGGMAWISCLRAPDIAKLADDTGRCR